jgi:hypothetical protein
MQPLHVKQIQRVAVKNPLAAAKHLQVQKSQLADVKSQLADVSQQLKAVSLVVTPLRLKTAVDYFRSCSQRWAAAMTAATPDQKRIQLAVVSQLLKVASQAVTRLPALSAADFWRNCSPAAPPMLVIAAMQGKKLVSQLADVKSQLADVKSQLAVVSLLHPSPQCVLHQSQLQLLIRVLVFLQIVASFKPVQSTFANLSVVYSSGVLQA